MQQIVDSYKQLTFQQFILFKSKINFDQKNGDLRILTKIYTNYIEKPILRLDLSEEKWKILSEKDKLDVLNFNGIVCPFKVQKVCFNFIYSELKEKEVKRLAIAIKDQKDINYLEIQLYCSKIGLNASRYIFEAIKDLKKIKFLKLDMVENNLGDVGAQQIAEIIIQLQDINNMVLYLAFNEMSEKGPKNIVQAIQELKNLKEIEVDFSGNSISEELQDEISELEQSIIFKQFPAAKRNLK